MKKILFIILLCFTGLNLWAQNMPERGEIRRGNRLFEREDWQGALERYTNAITYSPTSFDANYNLANAKYKSEDFAGAQEIMSQLAADSLLASEARAEVYYNLGNTQFYQQKYKEALESYKSSMRLNHADTMAKYNYAYTKRLLEQEEQEEQDNQDQEQNQDNDNQNQDNQEQDNQEQNGEDNQEQDGEDNQEQEQESQPQQQEGQISEQQLQQILDAIQAQEDKTQEKLDEEKARGVLVRPGNNW